MSTFIRNPKFPSWNAHSHDVRPMLGLAPGGHLPDAGLAPRIIDGIKVWVEPRGEKFVTYSASTGLTKNVKTSTHRIRAECPHCGQVLSAGRLHQHVCKG